MKELQADMKGAVFGKLFWTHVKFDTTSLVIHQGINDNIDTKAIL